MDNIWASAYKDFPNYGSVGSTQTSDPCEGFYGYAPLFDDEYDLSVFKDGSETAKVMDLLKTIPQDEQEASDVCQKLSAIWNSPSAPEWKSLFWDGLLRFFTEGVTWFGGYAGAALAVLQTPLKAAASPIVWVCAGASQALGGLVINVIGKVIGLSKEEWLDIATGAVATFLAGTAWQPIVNDRCHPDDHLAKPFSECALDVAIKTSIISTGVVVTSIAIRVAYVKLCSTNAQLPTAQQAMEKAIKTLLPYFLADMCFVATSHNNPLLSLPEFNNANVTGGTTYGEYAVATLKQSGLGGLTTMTGGFVGLTVVYVGGKLMVAAKDKLVSAEEFFQTQKERVSGNFSTDNVEEGTNDNLSS